MAPSRGPGFDGQLFFIYDREAVTTEGDSPEDAIIYFYPPSASVESRISICGQLVGVSNFLTSVLDFAPVLIKLKSEKVALRQSGKYTMALGGSSSEPDSLLIRQLDALFSVFAFYHGSFDIVQKFSKNHTSFLSKMSIIWDCYLPFIRYYGDTLPAVFDPLPFLKTPKNSSTCFLRASHILQACQRRRHILGGCILYKKSVLCTQLEACITRRLLLLKPNQSHHPAKQVKTEINLPFGVRILHSFLTLCEYERLIKELSRSPYCQNSTSEAKPSSTSHTNDQDTEAEAGSSGECCNGLLHRSVRKRIETEYKGLSQAKESGRKVRLSRQIKRRVRERTSKEKSAGSVGEEISSSPLKYEPQRKYKETDLDNGISDGNELRIDTLSESVSPVITENTTVKTRDEQDGENPIKVENVMIPFENECQFDDLRAANTSLTEPCTKSLTQNRRMGDLVVGGSFSYPTLSNGTDTTRDDCYYDECILGEEELTMDEVDVTDLKITTYDIPPNEDVHNCCKVTTQKSKEQIKEVCHEVINELIEQIVNECDKGSNGRISMNGSDETVFDKSTRKGLSAYSIDAKTSKGAASEMNQDLDISARNDSEPASLSLDPVEPIKNGLVCNSNGKESFNETSTDRSNIFNADLEENKCDSSCNNCSNEDGLGLQYSDKVSVGAIEAVPSISNIYNKAEVKPNGKQEKEERTSATTLEERQKNGDCKDLCKGSKEILIDSSSDEAYNDPNETVSQDNVTFSQDDESPGSEYHDSLEDLLADGARSKDSFLEKCNNDFLQNYRVLKKNEFGINKYSSQNLNLPDEKDLKKIFFKDIIDGEKRNFGNAGDKTDAVKVEDLASESLDCEAREYNKDSRTPSMLSGDGTSLESFTPGCPGDCKNILGNSGVCLFHEAAPLTHSESEAADNTLTGTEIEASDNPSTDTETDSAGNPLPRTETEASDNLSTHTEAGKVKEVGCTIVPDDHHGNDSSSELVDEHNVNSSSKEDSKQATEKDNEGLEFDGVLDDEELDENDVQLDDGMVHLNLYVQAHSNTVLILLAEKPLHTDHETIKALWKTSLNELGELEVRLNQCHENLDQSLKPEDYSYLVYDGLSNTTKGNLEEPVLQADHMFCDTAKTVHEQFNNCSSLRSVTLRNSSSAVHCQRSLGQEVYFHKKGSFKSFLGSPSTRDPVFSLEKRACKLLRKDHGVNVF